MSTMDEKDIQKILNPDMLDNVAGGDGSGYPPWVCPTHHYNTVYKYTHVEILNILGPSNVKVYECPHSDCDYVYKEYGGPATKPF